MIFPTSPDRTRGPGDDEPRKALKNIVSITASDTPSSPGRWGRGRVLLIAAMAGAVRHVCRQQGDTLTATRSSHHQPLDNIIKSSFTGGYGWLPQKANRTPLVEPHKHYSSSQLKHHSPSHMNTTRRAINPAVRYEYKGVKIRKLPHATECNI